MRTVVLQSFRTHDVPEWLLLCMQSVKSWTESHAWDYAFMDDAFLELAPSHLRGVCGANIYALTDVCRLLWVKQMLEKGYERVVWADADLLIFAPHKLRLDGMWGHGFAREIFLRVERAGLFTPIEGINNALMFFEQGDPTLEVYLQAVYGVLEEAEPGKVLRTALGPHLLKSLDGNRHLNRIEGVGLFTQAVMSQLVKKKRGMFDALTELHGRPLAAANLCHFLRNATPHEQRVEFDAVYQEVALELLRGTL